jgi:bifunctional UDP-N-acetylglucosamine pyrophosphorylase/glucosamine-1-phosphate N-acetyltransferase
MLLHILDAVSELEPDRAVVVVGHGAERVTKKITEQGPPGLALDFVEQRVQRGTGDAAMVALTAFPDDDLDGESDVLVLPGDTPLLKPETLQLLTAVHRETDAAATLLTTRLPNPTGYGRVCRGKNGNVNRIVEEADATLEERRVDEVNTSIYVFRRSLLAPALRRLTPENAQGEYYLTDVIAVLAEAGYVVDSLVAEDQMEAIGVNDRAQLAVAEAELRRRTNSKWLAAGVTMLDPEQTYVDTTVRLSPDVTLFPTVILQGQTVVGARAEIGPGSRLVDCVVGEDAVVTHTVAHDAEIGAGARVGPFADLTPGTAIPEGAVTGPFYTPPPGGPT